MKSVFLVRQCSSQTLLEYLCEDEPSHSRPRPRGYIFVGNAYDELEVYDMFVAIWQRKRFVDITLEFEDGVYLRVKNHVLAPDKANVSDIEVTYVFRRRPRMTNDRGGGDMSMCFVSAVGAAARASGHRISKVRLTLPLMCPQDDEHSWDFLEALTDLQHVHCQFYAYSTTKSSDNRVHMFFKECESIQRTKNILGANQNLTRELTLAYDARAGPKLELTDKVTFPSHGIEAVSSDSAIRYATLNWTKDNQSFRCDFMKDFSATPASGDHVLTVSSCSNLGIKLQFESDRRDLRVVTNCEPESESVKGLVLELSGCADALKARTNMYNVKRSLTSDTRHRWELTPSINADRSFHFTMSCRREIEEKQNELECALQ